MTKIKSPGSTALFPVPAVMVSCGYEGFRNNIITIAWAGTVNSAPPMVSVSIRANRYSYQLVKSSGEFVVNIPQASQVESLDYCGVVSGADHDKFKELKLTPEMGTLKYAPLISECPVNLECKVVHELELGTHTMFIGEVKQVYIEESFLNEQGRVNIAKLQPLAYCSPHYHLLGERAGQHGMTKK